MKYVSSAGALAVLLALAQSLAQPAHTRSQSADEAQLSALAQESVEAQNDILVSGDVEGALKKKPKAASYRAAIEKHFATLVGRRAALAKKKGDYKSHKTEVRVKAAKVEGTKATQTVTEQVTLTLDPSIGGPKETTYTQDHVLEYVKEGDQWRMTADTLVVPPPEPEEIKVRLGPDDLPAVEPPPGVPVKPRPRDKAPGGAAGTQGRAGVSFLRTASGPSAAAAYGSYNPNAAVDYAYRYWGPYDSNFNPAYRVYEFNDCTNFISQCLYAGGWPYDQSGSRDAPDTWFYSSLGKYATSYSWAAAHNFYLFTKQANRAFLARYFSELIPGDVLQADFGPVDGNIQHTMLVTAKDNYGQLYLTYHSNNTRNRPLDDLRASYPGSNWYGWGLYLSYP
jgi:hypothetical protein